ncbi:MAG: hypothetical protein ABIR47_04540, partial [Candidatus Kapaibacterium sp.]
VGGYYFNARSVRTGFLRRWSLSARAWRPMEEPQDFALIGSIATSARSIFVAGAGKGGGLIKRFDRDHDTWKPMPGVSLWFFNDPSIPLAVDGPNLYVGGVGSVGDSGVGGIAMWNETTGRWRGLGSGINRGAEQGIETILADSGSVYIGGRFLTVDGVDAVNVARWDRATSSWSPLDGGTDGEVGGMLLRDGDLYIAGNFTHAGDSLIRDIARWNRTTGRWNSVSSLHGRGEYFPIGSIRAMAATPDGIYIGGTLNSIEDRFIGGLCRFNLPDGTLTQMVNSVGGNGPSGSVNMLLAAGGRLYLGGDFGALGQVAAVRVGVRTSTGWSALGGGLPAGDVLALAAAPDGSVYAGGTLRMIGTDTANHIERWDSTAGRWLRIADGIDGDVSAMAIFKGELYAAGSFTVINGASFLHIARWDGTNWNPLPGGGTSDVVSALAADSDYLYVAGAFTTAGGLVSSGIARFDGIGWSTAGGVAGENEYVRAVAVYDGDVYIGGSFASVGGVAAAGIARLHGGVWYPFGAGIASGTTAALAAGGGHLYAGGNFTMAGDKSIARLAEWSGGAWHPLGSGVNGAVSSLALLGDDLYIGGSFSAAGGLPSVQLARWSVSGEAFVPSPARSGLSLLGAVRPNPCSGTPSIPFTMPSRGHVSITIVTTLGTEVATILDDNLDAGEYAAGWNATDLPCGIYFCRLIAGEHHETTRLVVAR